MRRRRKLRREPNAQGRRFRTRSTKRKGKGTQEPVPAFPGMPEVLAPGDPGKHRSPGKFTASPSASQGPAASSPRQIPTKARRQSLGVGKADSLRGQKLLTLQGTKLLTHGVGKAPDPRRRQNLLPLGEDKAPDPATVALLGPAELEAGKKTGPDRSRMGRNSPNFGLVLSSVEDPEEIPAKRLKTECVSGASKEPEEVAVAAELPPGATSRSQETKERDDYFFSDSEDEIVYISSDSSFVASAEDEHTKGSVEMPCETSPCLTEETPSSLSKRIPYLSLSRNNHIRAAAESPVTPRPPIKEPGPSSRGVSGTRRPLCAAEEDVQQAENKKYKEFLSLFKEKYSGRLTSPRPARLNKVQAKEPGMTGSPLKEQKPRGASPAVPERTRVKHGDVFSPQLPQRGVMISYCTLPEDSHGRGKREKRAASVGQRDAEVPQRKLFQFHVTPVLSKDLFFVDSEPVPRQERPADELAPLTEAMDNEVSAAFDCGEPEDILSKAFKLTVTREDICTLQPLGWLNDRIMNFYMGLLVERSKKEGYPAVYAFNTFFYAKLSSTGHKGVKKWTKGVDIFQHDIILVPIHLRTHWTLLVVDLREKTIKYFDSLGQKGDHICKTILKYLEEESRERRSIELTAFEWTLHSMGTQEIPQQNNGHDCGVFVCKFADFISRDKPIIFTPEHMPYFRRKMVWEIMHQQLLGDMH